MGHTRPKIRKTNWIRLPNPEKKRLSVQLFGNSSNRNVVKMTSNYYDYCYRFPTDPQQLEMWKENVHRHNKKSQNVKIPKWEFKDHHRVCERHFELDCLIMARKKTFLKPKSVPTIFDNNKQETKKLAELRQIIKTLSELHQRFQQKINSLIYTPELHKLIDTFRQHIINLSRAINLLHESRIQFGEKFKF